MAFSRLKNPQQKPRLKAGKDKIKKQSTEGQPALPFGTFTGNQ